MEAIENIIRLSRAETLKEMDEAMMDAHTAINDLHLQKIRELERDVARRTMHTNDTQNRGMSPQGEAEQLVSKRRVRDIPQA